MALFSSNLTGSPAVRAKISIFLLSPCIIFVLVLAWTQLRLYYLEKQEAIDGKFLWATDYPEYPPPSLYENRTGKHLPKWARKHFFLPSTVNKTVGEKSVCFVHVGKTAGTTIACYLGFLYRYHDKMRIPKSRLMYQTGHLIHNWINDCDPTLDDYYLFAMRDPISRIKSWFSYEKPHGKNYEENLEFELRKELFLECPFNTIGELAEKGLTPLTGSNKTSNNSSSNNNHNHSDGSEEHEEGDKEVVSDLCRQRAHDAITGSKPYYRHNYYNYQYYRNQTPANAPILVIRQEQLKEDWISAETVLVSNVMSATAQHNRDDDKVNATSAAAPTTTSTRPNITVTFPRWNPSSHSEETDTISPIGMKQLCRALCREIQVYKEILHRAINLEPHQVQESIDLLRTNCPLEADTSTC